MNIPVFGGTMKMNMYIHKMGYHPIVLIPVVQYKMDVSLLL